MEIYGARMKKCAAGSSRRTGWFTIGPTVWKVDQGELGHESESRQVARGRTTSSKPALSQLSTVTAPSSDLLGLGHPVRASLFTEGYLHEGEYASTLHRSSWHTWLIESRNLLLAFHMWALAACSILARKRPFLPFTKRNPPSTRAGKERVNKYQVSFIASE